VKLIRVAVFCSLVAFCSAGARADTIAYYDVNNGNSTLAILEPDLYYAGNGTDPKLLVRRLKRGSIHFRGSTFSFNANTGAGFFDYYNGNDMILSALTVTIDPGGLPSATASIFSCGIESEWASMPFNNCSFVKFGTDLDATVIAFFGGPGLPPYSHFSLDLAGFPANAAVVVTAELTPAPEPASFALFLVGLLGLGVASARRARCVG